ncbi:MAG: hypothetical protein ACOZDY_00785 [Pseudomonadota bacterium]
MLIAIVAAASLTGCSKDLVGGAALGAAAAGGAYEYQNKEAMDQLEADRAAGRITQDEYERRKKEIESKSLVY